MKRRLTFFIELVFVVILHLFIWPYITFPYWLITGKGLYIKWSNKHFNRLEKKYPELP